MNQRKPKCGQQRLSTQQRTCCGSPLRAFTSACLSTTLRVIQPRTTGMTKLLTLASSEQSLEGAARTLWRRQGSDISASQPARV